MHSCSLDQCPLPDLALAFLCRDMTEKRMPHLRWRERRPPMLAFESYVLVQKLAQPDQDTGAAKVNSAAVAGESGSSEAEPVQAALATEAAKPATVGAEATPAQTAAAEASQEA